MNYIFCNNKESSRTTLYFFQNSIMDTTSSSFLKDSPNNAELKEESPLNVMIPVIRVPMRDGEIQDGESLS